jgi:formate dehydrogenase (coenzyme F420) beta subunit
LAAENQIKEGTLRILVPTKDNDLNEFSDLTAMAKYVQQLDHTIHGSDQAAIKKIEAMTMEERFAYWRAELARCIKCYACRASCPMCYCSRCTVDCNQPQWVPVASHEQGNFEWHLVRAMHLAGRCVECGECGRACPLDIPIHLLTMKVAADVFDQFGSRAGLATDSAFPLAHFQVADKEDFIG